MGGGAGGGGSQGPSSYSYTYHGDPRATFAQFFGSNNPFESFFTGMGGMGGGNRGGFAGFPSDGGEDMDVEDNPFFNFGGGGRGPGGGAFRSQSFNMHGPGMGGMGKEKVQDPPIEYDLNITLEDVLKGCTKKMKISRKVYQPDGTSRKEDKVLTINVKPGWKAGTKITFQREGDQTPNKIPADIVFIIRDRPHPHFKRDGSDLRYTAKISLKEVCNYVTLPVKVRSSKTLTSCFFTGAVWYLNRSADADGREGPARHAERSRQTNDSQADIRAGSSNTQRPCTAGRSSRLVRHQIPRSPGSKRQRYFARYPAQVKT